MSRRTLTWVRGLKLFLLHRLEQLCRRTLTWVRGLKLTRIVIDTNQYMSHPYMGAWIETAHRHRCY